MKRFLISLISFAFISSLIYLIFLIVWGLIMPVKLMPNLIYVRGGYGSLYSRLREADTTKNLDILFLGTSHAYRGYDTRIFHQAGYKIFNLGSSAQTPIQTEYLLKKHLHQLNPKLVVFDIYPLILGTDGTEPTLDLTSNSESIDKGILKMIINVNNIKAYNTLIYSCFRRFFKLDKNYVEPIKKGSDTYIGGGYVETYKVFNEKKDYNKTKYIIDSNQFSATKRIIALLKKEKIPYVIVQAPLSQGLYKSITNNAQIDSNLRSLGNYTNFNTFFSLPDSVFADDNHLNQNGVKLYNKEFISLLHNNSISLVRSTP